jgi:hypothetical protein
MHWNKAVIRARFSQQKTPGDKLDPPLLELACRTFPT